ncbi:glycosyl transferase [Arenimonas soli]|uniref:Glycosyl transferase n=1 Tax=Arenimonas soli TaxID=2269504 RepID=A0ABQ1HE00_9GAMM|nr:glycosyltransferase [Arenimonas soli]GGA73162.1 glycosyl transferase [Arenimonas soli]
MLDNSRTPVLDTEGAGVLPRPPVPSGTATQRPGFYVPVTVKFVLLLVFALAWMAFSIWLSQPWLRELSLLAGLPLAIVAIAFIAYLPGLMNAFLAGSILSDRRPRRLAIQHYPDLDVLVACFNEAGNIADTLQSLSLQDYPGRIRVTVIDDGSTDDTQDIARRQGARLSTPDIFFQTNSLATNVGKAGALNQGLAATDAALVITVDGDSYLRTDAIRKLVERFLSDPPNTVAVAGAVLVRNSRENWLTRAQEWDYFHGIAAVKRMQSMFHGTLVAQGAFSLYTRDALEQVGGWPDCVGEDIVLSWAMLKTGARIGYCEEACLFTNVPETLGQFARQRQRWSRGLMEAFGRHGSLLVKPRLSTFFIWWNLMFLPMDLVFTLVFIPGIIAAFFGYFWVVGLMTLLVLPLAMLWNAIIFHAQQRMFKTQGLAVRRNVGGFLFYSLGYTLLLQPICVLGYGSELLGFRKTWGTK